jgi:hypothetical protein
MPGGMRASRVLPRSLALAGAVVVLCAGPAAVARADDAGTTVVGELVQAWPETSSEDQHAGESHPEPLTFVEAADGRSVRIRPDGRRGHRRRQHRRADPRRHPGRRGRRRRLRAGAPGARRAGRAGRAPGRHGPGRLGDPPGHRGHGRPAGRDADGTALADVVDTVNGDVADFWSGQTGGTVTVGVTAAHDWITTTAGCATPPRCGTRPPPASASAPDRAGTCCSTSPAARGTCPLLLRAGPGRDGGRRRAGGSTSATTRPPWSPTSWATTSASATPAACSATARWSTARTGPARAAPPPTATSTTSWALLGPHRQPHRRPGRPARRAAHRRHADRGGRGRRRRPSPRSAPAPAPRVLRLTGRRRHDYWLEYRTAVGRDAWLAVGQPLPARQRRAAAPFRRDARHLAPARRAALARGRLGGPTCRPHCAPACRCRSRRRADGDRRRRHPPAGATVTVVRAAAPWPPAPGPRWAPHRLRRPRCCPLPVPPPPRRSRPPRRPPPHRPGAPPPSSRLPPSSRHRPRTRRRPAPARTPPPTRPGRGHRRRPGTGRGHRRRPGTGRGHRRRRGPGRGRRLRADRRVLHPGARRRRRRRCRRGRPDGPRRLARRGRP